ncbi:SAM-dependent methyltransferase [Marimonas lutisalis]|uniref:SAM-dependent methyltransferase n=1 Tax=Marimonas lutisalis TaxID=2545756 RepID=UPI0010F92ED5|nr:class I SAM-dependent methyltransferase [Marimonas lutisalis]
MWEERFSTPDYVFGKEPAQFLRDHETYLAPGLSALSVADGEGRNSVFMAQKGLAVTALEFAPSAIRKARALAAERDVSVDFRQFDVLAQDFEGEYDIVAGIFIQFVGPVERGKLFRQMQRVTKPGGIVLLHGYTPEQIQHGTGGPPDVRNMYTCKTLRESFPGWEVLECREYEREVQEGRGHSGMSALIDFIARKPA